MTNPLLAELGKSIELAVVSKIASGNSVVTDQSIARDRALKKAIEALEKIKPLCLDWSVDLDDDQNSQSIVSADKNFADVYDIAKQALSEISELMGGGECLHKNTKIWEPHLAGARKCLDCEMVYNPNHPKQWFYEE